MKTILLCSAVAAAMLAPAAALAQSSPDTAAIDQRVAADREAIKAAYATKDNKKVAEAQARARKDYALQYEAHHPRVTKPGPADREAAIKAADETAARDRTELHAALLSKDPKRISEAEAASRKADRDAYLAHHPSDRKPT